MGLSVSGTSAPRHGLGAVAIGDFIHVAGGGPVMGGGVQSAVHEAFTLAQCVIPNEASVGRGIALDR